MMKTDVRKYGAAGDGKRKDTQAIQSAVDACAAAGGGTVVIEDGTYLCGTLYLKSHVTLEIAASAVLQASPDIRDYGTDTHHNRYRNEHELDRCWIYAQDQEDIGICGAGTLHGNAEAFPNEGDIYRPMMLRFLRCRGIRLEGVKLLEAAAWTTAFLDSQDIHVRDVTIWNEKRYNGDGLDFDGCSNVYVDGCSITGTDDNLCLQSGSKQYVTENIHISNCTFTSLCAGIRIGLKSIGLIRDVIITNCVLKNVWREGIKIECTEGGSISHIIADNLVMRNVSRPLFLLLNNRFAPDDLGSSLELEEMPEIGRLEHVIFSNLLIEDEEEMQHTHYRFSNDIMGSPRFNGIRMDAEEHHKIKDVTLNNVRYRAFGGVRLADIPEYYPAVSDQREHPGEKTVSNYYPDWSRTSHMDIRNVEGLQIQNVILEGICADERPAFMLDDQKVCEYTVRLAGGETEHKIR